MAFRAYARLPENQARRLELDDGVIVEAAASTPENTVIAMRVGHFLNASVIPRKLGYVTGADGGFKLAERVVRQPDVAFVSKSRAPRLPEDFDFAPDFAVEVVSPREDVLKQVNAYLFVGTSIVWAVYGDERRVYVFTLNQDGSLHGDPKGMADVLDGGEVLPGFSLAAREIFPD